MLVRMKWLAAVLFVSLTFDVVDPVGTGCPESLQCRCSNMFEELEALCENGTSSFQLNIRPGNLVQVRCSSSAMWSNLPRVSVLLDNDIQSLVLTSCPLIIPSDSEKFIEQLRAQNLEYLAYEALETSPTGAELSIFPELKYLMLSGNRLDPVAPDLIKGLPKLIQLQLIHTDIRIPSNFFEKASSLKALELSGNNLKILQPGVFDGLTNLQLLNLWKNDLIKLDPDVFRNLPSLISLDIHQNKLNDLPSNIFKGLSNLEVINFSSNNLSSLPEGLFQNNLKLKTLKLLYNKANVTQLPSKLLANLTNLKFVSIVRSGLLELPEDLIWGSMNITYLNLNRNYLITLPANFLKDSIELSTLSVSFNDLKLVPDGIFSNSGKLKKLDLSRNHLTSINEYTLKGLNSLQELNMEKNDLFSIQINAFNSLENLKIAKFSNNKLTLQTDLYDVLSNISPFRSCHSLEELYLSYNNISKMYNDWIVSSRLQQLDLSHNLFDYLQTEDLQFVSNNVIVDLRHNSISQINLERLEHTSKNLSSDAVRNVKVHLEGNPINCGCDLYSLLQYSNKEISNRALTYVRLELGEVRCSGPQHMSGIKLSELQSSKLKCLVERSFPRPGNPCDPDSACDCWMKPADRALIIDCVAKNLTQPPTWIDTRTVELVELDLSMNRLEMSPNMFNQGYHKVRRLNLSGNHISQINKSLITPNLQTLYLNNNNLTHIDSEILQRLSNSSHISKLTLHDNPWRCDCGSRNLLSFIQSNALDIPDLLQVTCSNTNVSLSSISYSELCTSHNYIVIGICSLISFLGLLVGGGAALYFRFQREIKVWLFSKNMCLCLVSEEEVDRDKKYDAFISYSHKDEEFVVKELVARLEEGPRPYRLCIHVRDWLAGEWIPTQIARSVEESRRTIVVLSANFIESVWGRLEFQVAHKQALSERRARVIVVLYGDIRPTDNLDPELRAYLQMNTYVKWGDPWFWQKLRYAMPHSQSSRKSFFV